MALAVLIFSEGFDVNNLNTLNVQKVEDKSCEAIGYILVLVAVKPSFIVLGENTDKAQVN